MKIKFLYLRTNFFHLLILNTMLLSQGLILSNALRAQKNTEDESCTIALNNLRTEVIRLRNEALEKDKILLTLVDKVKGDEANFKAQSEIQRNEIDEAERDASDYWKNY
jgi:hypothetical protein